MALGMTQSVVAVIVWLGYDGETLSYGVVCVTLTS